MRISYDVAIVGAGPAGLSFACLASSLGLRVAVVEKEAEAVLADPPRDGRDIALTHRSVQSLKRLNVWDGLGPEEIAPIRRACVRNGSSADLLKLDSAGTGADALGYLVSNHVIRRALYRQARQQASIDLATGISVTGLDLAAARPALTLSSGATIEASLVVAADSRFSETRRRAGIGADLRDFGRVCIVCQMTHENAHDETAYEWFDTEQTLAVLPLRDRTSSIVLTLPSRAAPAALAQARDAFALDIERRFRGQWGRMELLGERYAYPLVAVYAHAFFARRFALVGDAAVGMHPVTAHGFNFGLRGAETLACEMRKTKDAGGDFAADRVLAAYDTTHRRSTYPLYLATNAMVGLYTGSGPLAHLARHALLRIGNALPPVKSFMVHTLTECEASRT
ncbi:MAG: 5-demethoxyubiquinol-8 5-hydroxylase UbiM [Hyphomicrobiaceae bacterium]